MLPALITLALSAIILFLYLRIRRLNLAVREVDVFAKSLLTGDYRRIYLDEREFGGLAASLNAMLYDVKNRIDEINEKQERLQAILQCMTDGVLIADNKGRIVLTNQALDRLFGIKTGITGETVVVAARNAELHNLVMSAIDAKDMQSGELDISYPGKRSVSATAAPLRSRESGENISGVVLSVRDITKVKRLEDMRKSFVANVSHELKTPVTAIKGFAETLLDGALDDRLNAVRFIETIKAHSERINSLVDDLLTISRIELGDIRIEKKYVELGSIIDTVFTTLMDKAKAKGLYLMKSMPSNPVHIHADKDRLIQIFLNLVENGIKFTERGGITAGIDNTGSRSFIFVSDTGMGVPKNHIPRLGERFYRVDSARSRELGGTGLGLAIVKHIVRAHEWDMAIESEQGTGTTVRILM